MRTTIAIMQRELLALFYSPIAYIVIAGFLLLTGILMLVSGSFAPGQPATLRSFFAFTPYVLTMIIPAITMRLISEEYRNGTIEPLMTAPITDAQMVVGKYLAALVFYAIMLLGTFVYLLVMMFYGKPDFGASVASYIGLLLVGAAFLGFGMFTSSVTRNQIVAWILGTVPLLLLVWFAAFIATKTEGVLREAFQRINVERHLDQFNRGLVTTESVAFFVATAVLFVFLSVKVVESKRWR
ncbi:MAG: ABC transporter permease [Planctomycetes bacterium]|nr:ABC transporter permease [Planctomycetota bacterium]